ncbi:MAG: carboxypeptidase regulatory-like domain-containing protein [Gemmatimonadales bacterium]
MALIPRWLPALGVAMAWAEPAQAQTVRGAVLAEIGRTPIANASVIARRSGTAVTTDRLGRYAIDLPVTPDTIVVAAIGYQPDTVRVTSPDLLLTVLLERAPVVISDLIATAAREQPLDLSSHGRWQMPIQAARTIPPAVETDVYRALALIPAVSFTSPLSARPMIRGYDAQEVVTRIDGFEVLNLFHLGRIFSSFPADATEEIGVTVAPYTSANGGSVAGIIDIVGRTGPVGRTTGGGGFSFGSLSAGVGSGSERIRYFSAARVFHVGALRLIPGVDIPYHFEDVYGGLVFGPSQRPTGRITLFATQDRAGAESKDLYLNWDNVVLGTRWRLFDRARTSFELATSAALFREDGDDVPSVRTFEAADIRNRFGRLSVTGDLVTARATSRLATGFSLGWRRIENRIGEASPGGGGTPQFQRAALDVGRVEWGGYLEATRRLGPVALEAAIRTDGAGGEVRVQPRVHARWGLSRRIELSTGLGRTSRLFHLLGEARSEPDFDFLDFWMNAGDSVPAARVDHATLDLNIDLAPLVARVSGYLSHGDGIGEVRPEYDARPRPFDFFRFGRSRTRGLEAQLAYRGDAAHPHSLSISYAYARSERDWGEGWLRWAQDRRHQFRVFGQAQIGRLTLFGAVDAATGMPTTAVDRRYFREIPGLTDAQNQDLPARAFGPENAVSTSGTFRVDAGFQWTIGERGARRLVLGAGVINLLQTAVAPIASDVSTGRQAVDRAGRAAPYGRLFDLPGIPTFTLRLEF